MADTNNLPDNSTTHVSSRDSASLAVRLLGQELYYPLRWTGALTLTVFCISLCSGLAIVYVFAKDRGYQHVETVLKTYSVNEKGAAHEVSSGGRVEFWAPSEDTYKNATPPPNYAWQKGVTKERIEAFEQGLDTYCTGWRRVAVFGKGTSGQKWGYWYSMTAREGFDAEVFGKYYRQTWNSTSPIFMEHVTTQSEYRNWR